MNLKSPKYLLFGRSDTSTGFNQPSPSGYEFSVRVPTSPALRGKKWRRVSTSPALRGKNGAGCSPTSPSGSKRFLLILAPSGNSFKKWKKLSDGVVLLSFFNSTSQLKPWSKQVEVQVDRNLVLCLPRLTILVSIEADRPGAWFPGP